MEGDENPWSAIDRLVSVSRKRWVGVMQELTAWDGRRFPWRESSYSRTVEAKSAMKPFFSMSLPIPRQDERTLVSMPVEEAMLSGCGDEA